MKDELLKEAIERLKDTKQEIIDRIHSYEEEIKKYKESNKELNDSLSVEVDKEKTEKWTRSLNACKTVKEHIKYYEDIIKKQKDIVTEVLNYNLNFGDLDHFFDKVLDIDGFVVETWYGDCTDISKATMIKFPYKASDLSNFNNIRGIILMKADFIVKQNIFFGKNNSNKIVVANEIIQMLKTSPIMSTLDGFLKYFSDNLKKVDEIAKENGEKIQEIREQEIAKRKDEIRKNIDEINRKIDECKKSLVSIGEIYTLYDEYRKTGSKDILIKITTKLADLVVISQRESKMITHDEKAKEAEVVEETPNEQKVEEIPQEKPKEFDNEYFMDKNTKRIICFLGTENDSIITDIEEFDKPLRKIVYDKLNDLFTVLKETNDNPFDGHGPGKKVSEKVKSLIKNPINAIYRTVGSGKTPYRIHSIEKSSKLLEKMGFAQGKLIFFGAVGQNNDEDKTMTYNTLGSRCIREIGNSNNSTVLRSNFDYIEHITRGYIPVGLLSKSDMDNYNKIKSNRNKVIEDAKYIYYDVLNNETMINVRSYLIEYFSKQTTIMSDIIAKSKGLKGNTLD